MKLDKTVLPAAIDYYRQQFRELKIKPEWTAVICPFHADKRPSLSLNLLTGGFHCFACAVRGRDIIAFHMQRYHLSFREAVSFFGAWR